MVLLLPLRATVPKHKEARVSAQLSGLALAMPSVDLPLAAVFATA